MSPDDIFEILVEANPVPDSDVATVRRLRPASARTWSTPMLTLEPETTSPTEHRRGRRSWLAAAAAILLIVAAAVAVAVVRNDASPIEPSTPVVTAGDPIASPPGRDARALTTAEEYFGALNAGDVDQVVAMSNSEFVDLAASRQMWEMNAALAEHYGAFQTVERCEVLSMNDSYVEVGCDVVVTDPVFAALGVAELVAPVRVFDDETVVWLPWRGGDFGQVNQAYADYLRAHHPAEFEAVCDPSGYEPGSVVVDKGIALTGSCAELWVPLAEEVAGWVTDGRP